MNKVTKEWFLAVPWGKVALVSWGDPKGEPVLLTHGWIDSAACFVPLVGLLPNEYYYVGIDLPGNGRSDHFPLGLPAWRIHYVLVIDLVVKHLGWKKFTYIGHSMGCELGIFYNSIRPGFMTKCICLDPLPAFRRLQFIRDPKRFFRTHFEEYYDNYHNKNYGYKVYTRKEAMEAVKRARGLNDEQAEIILSRNLIPLGDDKYRLSWSKRFEVPTNYDNEYYLEIFSKHWIPTLFIHMTDGWDGSYPVMMAGSIELRDLLIRNVDLKIEVVKGGHDTHVSSPMSVAEIIERFLKDNKCKL